jgi:protein-tyrosine-phosphatase
VTTPRNLDRATPWAFALGSSGTAALVGQPIHPRTVHALDAHGVDGRGHAAAM